MSVFSNITTENYMFESNYFFVIKDKFPVSKGHLLIISKREVVDFFSLNTHEKNNLIVMIDKCKLKIDREKTPDGYNIGMNCGAAAGQTVMHSHIHLIPRRDGDTPAPRGGVRGVIPNKMDY